MRNRIRTPRPLALLALLTAAALLALSGCGGSDDESATTSGGDAAAADESIATSDLNKAEWIVEADAICTDGNERIAQIAEEQYGDQKPEGAEFDAFVIEELAPNFRSQAEQIRELGAPAGDEELVDSILDKLERGADQIEDEPALADDPDADLLLTDASAEMQRYGAVVCGA